MKEPLFLRVPVLHVKAITLVFLVLYKGELDEQTRRHETIHFHQWLELWILGFAILYGWDFVRAWTVRSFRPSEFWNAYLCIRFEQEAYDHDKDPTYLKLRERNAWRYYDIYEPKFVTTITP